MAGKKQKAKPKDRKKLDHRILAHGEATGHKHEALEGTLYADDDGNLFLVADPETTTVRHEEHKPVKVPAVNNEVGRVQEYDHFAEEARSVQD
jgi:hypothetical protein